MKRRPVYSVPFFLLCFLCQSTFSSPVSRASRMIREVYPDDQEQPVSTAPESGNQAKVCIVGDVVYGLGEPVPSEQPCLKCLCEGVGVHCETRTCSHVPPGCKAIHRPNRCCPDYQCECQHEGKTYANGERLPSANGSECRVCYCRGGEVQCAEVGCYTRDDCQPRNVPGQCCPRYDHCPPKEPQSDRIQYTTLTPSILKTDQDYITTLALTGSPDGPSSTEKGTFENEGSGDDSNEFVSISTGVGSSSNELKEVVTPVIFSIKEIESKRNEGNQNSIKLDKGTQTEIERPKITIQEVTPKRSEFQITSSAKDITTMKNPIKIIEDSSNELIDSQTYASEKAEVYDHPPPVLRIGDQLLFFKQGQLVPEKDASTPSPVITLIGAEGLQIGVGSEEIIEHELLPTNNENKKDEGLQDISLSTDEKFESVTGSPTDSSSEEYIRVPEESKIVAVSTHELTTHNSLKSVSYPEIQNTVTIVKPIKRDGEQSKIEPTTEKLIPTTEESKISTSTEFIPEENPYYPPIPEDIIIIEDEHHEKTAPHSTTESSSESSSEETIKTVELTTEGKKLQEKTVKEFKNEGRLDELMLSDGPVSEESESESKEEPFEDKKLVEVVTKSREETTEYSAEISKRIHLDDPEISSEEDSSEEQKDQPINDEEVTKILPDIIPLRSNKTIPSSTEKPTDWLKAEEEDEKKVKEEDKKSSPPLINERAALPRDILEMAHETDSVSDEEDKKTTTENNVENITTTEEPKTTENLLVISLSESTTRKYEAITENLDILLRDKKNKEVQMATTEVLVTTNDKEELTTQNNIELVEEKSTETPIKSKIQSPENSITKVVTELEKSKETVETSEEASRETTTSKDQHTNIMAGDDASIEVTKDSSQIDTSELVETVPGFELTTQKKEKLSSEESSEENTASTNPKGEVEVLASTKPEEVDETVEKITTTTPDLKEKEETTTPLKIDLLTKEIPLETKDTKTDEKHKRDVVKKVLKDTFENPKENIQTELKEDAPAKVLEEIEHEHELAEKRAEEVSKEDQTTEKFDSEVKIEDDFGDNPTKIQKTTPQKQDEVIQRIGDVKKLRESTENLDTSLVGIFRDFFSKSQLRYASTEEKV